MKWRLRPRETQKHTTEKWLFLSSTLALDAISKCTTAHQTELKKPLYTEAP